MHACMRGLDIGLIKVASAPVHKADLADLTSPANTHGRSS